MPRSVEEEGVRLSGFLRKEEDAAWRAHDRIHNLRIGDQDVACVRVELDQCSLVKRKRDALRDWPTAVRGHVQHLLRRRFMPHRRPCIRWGREERADKNTDCK